MDWHALTPEVTLKRLKSSEKGLKESDVQKKFAEHGKNVIRKFKRKSKLVVFLGQFNSLLVYILILAAIVSGLIGHIVDAVVIMVIVFLNAGIGFYQEYKAEEIIDKLRKSLRYKALVLRDGVQKEVDSRFLVPGDILILNAGDRVLADCRVLESENLQTNEAVLTGESFPISKIDDVLGKDVVLAERKNMLYAGTSIVRGKSKAVVVGTGKETEFGKLADLVQITKDEKMPLEKKVDSFSKKISIAILVLVAIGFAVGVSVGIDRVEMFLVSVSLAVGAIPEGLPAVIAITLAVAVKQMYKVNTLIRRLPAAETLGRATVICTDKTGTLTEEELTAEKIYGDKKRVLKIGILCNSARDEKDRILGDPTEVALIKVAKKFGFDKARETEKNPKVKEYPFSSERKMMSIVRSSGKIKTSYVKGAPEVVLGSCTKEIVGGKIKLLTTKRRAELKKVYLKMEREGLRVLGFGFRQLTRIGQKDAEGRLTFAGFVGMIDPPRKEVKDAIGHALAAGIEIKIITGDAALTTKAIAEKIGLKGGVVEGKELDKLGDDKWDEVVRGNVIFARVTPQQKLKIVEVLKGQKETVAVTGDGVNDILALKRADIGISMGIRGSDVARDSSDMVLLDDNFASIVGAVREGRKVFANLKKSIKFLLSENAAQIFIVMVALLIGMPLPFLPLMILWMNLVTDSLPALAFAVEPVDGVMKRNPRSDGLLGGIWGTILVAGLLNFVSVMIIFNYGIGNFGLDIARTMAISTCIFFALFFAFACKSEKSLLKTGILNNKYLIGAVVLSFGLHLIAIYSSLGSVLGMVSLTGMQLGISVLAGLSGLIVFELWKGFRYFTSSRR
jgi:Ca2+-transporting ATPase